MIHEYRQDAGAEVVMFKRSRQLAARFVIRKGVRHLEL